MHIFILALLSCATCIALTPRTHVIHEKRGLHSSRWSRLDSKINRDIVVPVSIGLKQQNLEKGHDFLMDVSDPNSPNFGKHWSMDKIAETFAASADSIAAVKQWLSDSGISSEKTRLGHGQNWIKFNTSLAKVESLFRASYKLYADKETGEQRLGCDHYSLPYDLTHHIDFVTPTIHLDHVVRHKKRSHETHLNKGLRTTAKSFPILGPGPGKSPRPLSASNKANCNDFTTPVCLQTLYGFPNGTLANSSFGIVEYSPGAFKQSDLDLFYSQVATRIVQGTSPSVELVDGAVVVTDTSNADNYVESNLDLEYAIALTYPQNVTLYQVGDILEGGSFNSFLDAIDMSYCTFEGGDDQQIDPAYPNSVPGGYNKHDCGTIKPASVISTSYGSNEADLPAAYQMRQCQEYMKLGLAGTTFLYASGDDGVAGGGAKCCTSAKCAGATYNGGSSGTFNPGFPATCPYITAVGATQIRANATVTNPDPEQACESVIYSGGGFSNIFDMPDYQQSALSGFFKNHMPTYNSTQYNNSQIVRGYPDLSANGANYVVGTNGSLQQVFGTSASAPVVGSMITLINNERRAAGKGAVGFINPTIYANPDIFTDITSGSNPGCGTNGFQAVPGWDPVTGLVRLRAFDSGISKITFSISILGLVTNLVGRLGTIDYPKLLALFMSLP